MVTSVIHRKTFALCDGICPYKCSWAPPCRHESCTLDSRAHSTRVTGKTAPVRHTEIYRPALLSRYKGRLRNPNTYGTGTRLSPSNPISQAHGS